MKWFVAIFKIFDRAVFEVIEVKGCWEKKIVNKNDCCQPWKFKTAHCNVGQTKVVLECWVVTVTVQPSGTTLGQIIIEIWIVSHNFFSFKIGGGSTAKIVTGTN